MPKPKLPPAKALRALLHWMEERQRIYLQRQRGAPPPWTKDSILANYRFCNVYREQDRETEWLRENWREPYADHPNLWFACCLFRQINWSPTLQVLGFPEKWEPKTVASKMAKLKEANRKVYTSAYMVHSLGDEPKYLYTVYRVMNPLWASYQSFPLDWSTQTLESAHKWLMQHHGWGGFMAYEAVTDMRHTKLLSHATDIMTWANPGPGAKRGLNRIYGRPLQEIIARDDMIHEMQRILGWLLDHRDTVLLPALEMRDVEHVCCEFDKAERVKERLRDGKTVGLELFKAGVAHVGDRVRLMEKE